MKIEKLTPEQEAKLQVYRDKWLRIGLSTEPADRVKAESAIHLMYQRGGLEPPNRIEWFESPFAMVRHAKTITENPMGEIVYGTHDAFWLSFYDFFWHECGIEEVSVIDGLIMLAESAGWAMPRDEICLVSERHNILRRDDQGRLHCETGLALGYPDGSGVYAIHGVRVPGWVITDPDRITVKIIDDEGNAEVRRVMIDRFGLERYLSEGEAEEVSRDKYGILYRKSLDNDEDIVVVRVKNSTPEPDGSVKDYFLRVPPDISTPREAVAWTFGLGKDEYNPELET